MNQSLVTHSLIGICATLTWFWGDKVGIPPSAINLAAWIVPGLLAHALGKSTFPVQAKEQPAQDPVPSTTEPQA